MDAHVHFRANPTILRRASRLRSHVARQGAYQGAAEVSTSVVLRAAMARGLDQLEAEAIAPRSRAAIKMKS
jgi:hypothetical protein